MRTNVLPWLITGFMTIVAAGAVFVALSLHTLRSMAVEAQHALVRAAEEQRQQAETSEQAARKQAVAMRDASRVRDMMIQEQQHALEVNRHVRLDLEAAQRELATKTDELEVANRLVDSTNKRLASVMSELNIEIESLKKKLKEQELAARRAKDEAAVLQAELAALKKDE